MVELDLSDLEFEHRVLNVEDLRVVDALANHVAPVLVAPFARRDQTQEVDVVRAGDAHVAVRITYGERQNGIMEGQLLVSNTYSCKINCVNLTAPSIVFPFDSWWIRRLFVICSIENVIGVIN